MKLRIITIAQHDELQGGASFKVHFKSKNFLASYSVEDYFNGTYHGCYLVPKYCFTLTVDLLFVAYAAYYNTSPCPLKNSQIYKKTWCPSRRETINSRKPKLCTNCNSDEEGIWVANNDWLKYAERYKPKSLPGWSENVTDLNLTCTKHLFHRSSFRWFWKNTKRNCVVNQTKLSSRWKQCLQRFSSVFFLGDSHTRGLYSYIAHSVGANVTGDRKNKRKSTSYRNLHFQFIKFNRDVRRIFDRFLDNFTRIKMKRNPNEKSNGKTGKTSNDGGSNNLSYHNDYSTDKLDDHNDDDDNDDIKNSSSHAHNGKTTVVLFGFGTWQLSRVDFSSYFDTFPSIRQTFSKMVQFSNRSNIRWIYITTPSIWDNSKCFCKVSMNGNHPFANIFSTAAINAFTIQELKKSGLDFETFDYNSLTVHRNNEMRDLIHYLIEPTIHNGQTVYGTVGVAVTDILLTQLCLST